MLYDAGHLYEESKDDWVSTDYLQYLGVCRALAQGFDVDLRMLDRALWILGIKENY